MTTGTKARVGRFFEDFRVGQVLAHPVPRTVTDGDAALYVALTGSRFPIACAATAARRLGFRAAPIDDPQPAGADAPNPFAERLPNTVVVTHEGKAVHFYDDLIKGKIVLINFMYSTCKGR